jgi:hypothetical protein
MFRRALMKLAVMVTTVVVMSNAAMAVDQFVFTDTRYQANANYTYKYQKRGQTYNQFGQTTGNVDEGGVFNYSCEYVAEYDMYRWRPTSPGNSFTNPKVNGRYTYKSADAEVWVTYSLGGVTNLGFITGVWTP